MTYLVVGGLAAFILLVLLLLHVTRAKVNAERDKKAAEYVLRAREKFYDALRRPVSRGRDAYDEQLRSRKKDS